MKKFIFISLALLNASIIFAQTDFTSAERSKYHMNSPEELRIENQTRAFNETPPPTGGARNIAEFERNQGVIISYPNGFEIPYTLIAQLSDYVTVYIMCPSMYQSSVTTSLTNNGVNMDNVEYVNAPVDSEWARDYSPWFIEYGPNNQVGIVDFPYNRPMRVNDDEVPIVLGDYFDMDVFGMDLEHTGGNYMTDGLGISASCDLVYEENPGLSESEIDQLVEDYMGITTYHCVPDPLADYIEHIDCWGKFLDVDKMLVSRVPASDDRYADFEAMADYWENQVSSYGNNYQVYRTNWMVDKNAYTNSLIMNDKVFVAFNTGSAGNYNEAAAAVYEEAMPGYEIIGILYNGWESTDALHCRTHEVPDFEMLRIVHMPYYGMLEYASAYNFEAEVYSFNNSNNISSVKLYYSENGGEYLSADMINTGGNIYSVSIEGLAGGSEIKYYIEAIDDRPKTETHPFIGNADPHVFTIEDVSGICNTAKAGYIKAYPNPATEVLYFINNNTPVANYNITIYNEQGSIVKLMNIDLNSSDWNIQGIDISDLKSGLYYISASSEKGEFSTRFIKM
ncbi:MAG: agmatine deiminase family protein [Bacteroidales bacterium]|nr:agmatine deiminase family protein [Bacteroidales bacterium]